MAGWDLEKLKKLQKGQSASRIGVKVEASTQWDPLSRELLGRLEENPAQLQAAERAADRILQTLSSICSGLGLVGDVKAFGSFSSGLKRGSSDLDVSLLTPQGAPQPDGRDSLGQILLKLPGSCENVTKVFMARTPLIKFTDADSGLEVDFCINNQLGYRNTLLLSAYCEFDIRVKQLGRLVKDWAKANGLVGTAEGYLNSYAYMLLVVFFFQQCSPPVLPNLQLLAKEAVPVVDTKWDYEDVWDTKFFEDVGSMERSGNTMSVGELLVAFFLFYANFDFDRHAVCLRLSRERVPVNKFDLTTPTSKDQWYVEDPFDLRHNLAAQCSPQARAKILELMRAAGVSLGGGGAWREVCQPKQDDRHFIRCRVTASVTPVLLLDEFRPLSLQRLYYPRPLGLRAGAIGKVEPQAFLEFVSSRARRAAHVKNEVYIGDCQVIMMDAPVAAFEEATQAWSYDLHEAAPEARPPRGMPAFEALEAALAAPLPSDDDDDFAECEEDKDDEQQPSMLWAGPPVLAYQ